MTREAPHIPIDAAIRGARNLLSNPKVNSGLKEYQRKRLQRLLELKARGVKEIQLGKKGV